jgi:anthranilate synthase component 2
MKGDMENMILLIDQYDPRMRVFYQTLSTWNPDLMVVRNDEMTPEELAQKQPEALILFTGAGLPKDTGFCMDIIRFFCGKVPILGIGLGHLTIGAELGATIGTAAVPMQVGRAFNIGVDTSSVLFHDTAPIVGCIEDFSATVLEQQLPECLRITARDEYGRLIAMEHTEYPVYGLQVCPQSLLEGVGKQVLNNFFQSLCS